MRRAIPIWVLTVVLTATWCVAQKPPVQPPTTPDKRNKAETSAGTEAPPIPEQKLTFDVSEETSMVTIEAKALVSNTKLQQLRYVARVEVFVVYSREVDGKWDLSLLHAFQRLYSRGPASLDSLAARLPDQHPLSKELLSELLSHGRLLGLSGGLEPSPIRGDEIRGAQAVFEVLAPSPQRAKELAQGVLVLFDYSFYRPMRQIQLENLQLHQRELAESSKRSDAAEAEVARLEDVLDKETEYSDIDVESLPSLTTQQRMIAVDLAGVTARLEACIALLDKTQKSPSRDRLEELKVTAEIELVGLSAKKGAIDAIVKGARARLQTRAALSKARATRRLANQGTNHTKSRLEEAEKILEESTPLKVVEDVPIRRIEWAPVESKRAQGDSAQWWES